MSANDVVRIRRLYSRDKNPEVAYIASHQDMEQPFGKNSYSKKTDKDLEKVLYWAQSQLAEYGIEWEG